MRLIDADDFRRILREIQTDAEHFDNEQRRNDIGSIMALLDKQPTAFDTEKVVEQLEERTLNSKSAQTEAIIGMCGASANYYHGEADAYINAIDIVKKGGVE